MHHTMERSKKYNDVSNLINELKEAKSNFGSSREDKLFERVIIMLIELKDMIQNDDGMIKQQVAGIVRMIGEGTIFDKMKFFNRIDILMNKIYDDL